MTRRLDFEEVICHLVVKPLEEFIEPTDLKLNLALQFSVVHLQMPYDWFNDDILLIQMSR
jgi:hypothetical protein